MKKLLFCSAVLLGMTQISFATLTNVRVTKTGGGPNGYDRVSQNTGASGQTNLYCENMGFEKCEAMDPPAPSKPKASEYNSVMNIVDTRMQGGATSGRETILGFDVVWQGSDVYNYVLDITDAEVE